MVNREDSWIYNFYLFIRRFSSVYPWIGKSLRSIDCMWKIAVSVFYAPAIRRMVAGHKVLPLSVRSSVRPWVRPSDINIWCPLNNFWKTASIQFKFGMLIYNIKTQVKLDLGYNPHIFDGVMGLLYKHSTKIGVRSVTFERLHRFDSYFAYWYIISKHRSSWIWVTIH